MSDGDSSALTPQLGRTVVAGPKTVALATRGLRRWADGNGLDEAATAELLDMLDITPADERDGAA